MKNSKIGISTVRLCVIHSLVFVLFTFVHFGLKNNYLIDFALALIGLCTLVKIIPKANLLVIVILLNSITLILFSIFIDVYLDIHNCWIYLGGFGMVIGHYLNYKLHSKK
jgi:hypothetical protein